MGKSKSPEPSGPSRLRVLMLALLLLGVCLVAVSLAAYADLAMADAGVVRADTEPLLLTPMLEAGDAEAARAAARVPALLDDCCESYAGFLTVNASLGANMFFWFFPSETRRDSAPLVVWLQGGPGTSLMRSVLIENGPYLLDGDNGDLDVRRVLRRRQGTWTRSHAVLYFDNPIGTGYSFANGDESIPRNLEQVSAALGEALLQFYRLFPELRARDLYIAGESWGGKMATGLAHRLLHRGAAPEAAPTVPKGLIIVNALMDAARQVDKSELAFELGLVDEAGRDGMKAVAEKQARLIAEGRGVEALALATDECGSALSPGVTGYSSITNLLLADGSTDDGFDRFAERADVRRALHVSDVPFKGRSAAVGLALLSETTVSALPMLAEVADGGVRVLVVNGQFDLCMPYRMTANYLRQMAWRGAAELDTARRTTWCVGSKLAGYSKTVRNLTHVLVRNAGHYLGQDQPVWGAEMLSTFTAGRSFETCPVTKPGVPT